MRQEDQMSGGGGPAAGLDRLDEPDEVYERRVTELHEIEREAAGGRIDADALERRRSEALRSITHHVMGGQLSSYSSVFDGLDQTELFPDGMYVPSEAPPSWVPTTRRYSLEWTSPDVAGLGQSKAASQASGKVHVINLALSSALQASGTAQAAVGIEVKLQHPLARVTLWPELSYRWRYILQTPTLTSNVPWSKVWSNGRIRLIAQRQDPVTGVFETYLQRQVELWSMSFTQGSGESRMSESGSYPAADPGLVFIGSSGSTFALWVIASVYASKQDFDAENASICHGELDLEVPAMQVTEVAL